MKKRIVFFAAILVFLFAGSLFAQGLSIAPKIEFSDEEFLQDYDQVWEDLEENYPFFSVLQRRGINVESVQKDNREVLSSRIQTIDGFAQLLRDTFFHMDNFAHLSLVDSSLYQFFLENPSSARDEVVAGAQTKATYEWLQASERVPEPRYPEVVFRCFPDSNAVYFHFQSFSFSLIERDQSIVFDYLSEHPDVQHIIIDITGNGGGAGQYWIENIVSPFGERYVWENDYALFKRTPVNERIFFDNESANPRPLSELPIEYVKLAFIEELDLTHFYDWKSAFPAKDFSGNTIGTQAKRWVLIDQGVYSAADSFAAFCKSSGFATLVGTMTSGDGGSDKTEPAVIVLPNTGLLVRFSSSTCANEDGSMNTEIGTSPDIFCLKRENPLDTCLRMINKMR